MTILKNASRFTNAKRKLVAMLAIAAFVLPTTPVSAAPAADPLTQAYQQAITQTVSTVDAVTDAPAVQPTVQEVLLDVCKENGYGEDCAKTLLGMLWNESSNKSTVIGDHGAARGYFQIHYKLHKISIECAEDLVCSANWSLNYMEQHSYPKYVKYAVQCHNSCGVNNGYAAKAIRHGQYFWDKPLEITQAAPIEIPVVVAIK